MKQETIYVLRDKGRDAGMFCGVVAGKLDDVKAYFGDVFLYEESKLMYITSDDVFEKKCV
ncbi:MAG: hypothetical protein WC254_06515 [Candidatus Woesearchaeota archaeon]